MCEHVCVHTGCRWTSFVITTCTDALPPVPRPYTWCTVRDNRNIVSTKVSAEGYCTNINASGSRRNNLSSSIHRDPRSRECIFEKFHSLLNIVEQTSLALLNRRKTNITFIIRRSLTELRSKRVSETRKSNRKLSPPGDKAESLREKDECAGRKKNRETNQSKSRECVEFVRSSVLRNYNAIQS